MADYAVAADVAAMWRTLSGDETTKATTLITRASVILRAAVPALDARIATDPDLGETAKGVVVDMVLRVMKNPDGKLEESIDDYRWRRDSATSSGALYVSPTELASLLPPVGGLGGAYVVSLGG